MDLVDYLVAIVRLGGGEVAGKTRLQKIAYLLEAKGIGFGDIDFDYHNYGPFSSEVAFAADDAESLGYLETEERQGIHAVPYTVFRSTDRAPKFDDNADTKTRVAALELMNSNSALVLELAATAVYLKRYGYNENCWEEVEKRKPLKATPQRRKLAERLLSELEL